MNGELTAFLDAHRFTRQTRRELAEWIPEIACREGITIGGVINGEAIQSVLRDEKLNAPQKHRKIRDELYKTRFPEFSKLLARWKKTVSSANPAPSKVHFTPSPGFEKKRLEIKLTVESAGEAREILKSLSEIDTGVWDDLLFPQ